MNARIKAVTIWTALSGAGILVAVLGLTGESAKTQTVNPYPPVELISRSAAGGQPNANSSGAIASGDGTCVAFYTDAGNILPLGPNGDSNGFTDVYVFDRTTLQTSRVSVGVNGSQPNGPSQAQRFRPAIDSGCTCVAFSSDASNLVENDTNRRTDIFLRDLDGQTTELISQSGSGESADGASAFASVSADCNIVAFHSVATNLVPDDTNRAADVFAVDRGAGTITRVSVGPGGEQANGASISPSVSADGRCVAFASSATNLLPQPSAPDLNRTLDIFVACDGVVTCRASVSSSGAVGNDMSFLPALNADGTIVAFKSDASNLVPDDRNQAADVFVHNCLTGETERVSVGDQGQEGDDIAIPPSISNDGRFVAFGSFASNLLRGVTNNGFSQVYVRDLLNDTTTLVSSNLDGLPGNAGVPDVPPSISADGEWVAFQSLASDLTLRDTQGYQDVYIRGNITVAPPASPTNTVAPTPTGTSPIPCTRDTDCPVGQVCGPNGVCVPAPTPTPTIACNDDEDCPDGLNCVNGICRDLSTPTATPTLLPTCVTDEDCPEGTQCRAMVCVPPRPCESQLECRGIRETCLDGFCECGGDCNTDGIVFGSEITKMVCIIGGMCELGICPAGDLNQDGEVTSADVTLAVINLGLGCPGEGSPLIYALNRTTETRTLDVQNVSGIPGEFINLEIGLGGGDEVTTAQVDIILPTDVIDVLSLTTPACTLHPRLLAAGSFEPEVTLPQVPPVQFNQLRLRVAVVDKMPPIDSFGPGPVFQCQFRIDSGVSPGSYQMTYDTNRLEIADPGANLFNAEVTGGGITVNQRPPCINDDECPEGTECKGGECRPIIECDGPTSGPEQCLDGRQACVNDQCVCLGDCNDDGIVRGAEITVMVTIINGLAPLSACPAADLDGDGVVRGSDVTIAVVNINEGCP